MSLSPDWTAQANLHARIKLFCKPFNLFLFYLLLVPVIQFVKTSYSTNEETGSFSVVLMRAGDLRYMSSVRCYTRSMTAQVDVDFKERPDRHQSVIVFNPGEKRKSCPVTIVDDLRFEGKETFRLRLGSVNKESRIGERNSTVITIVDAADSKFFSCIFIALVNRE